MHSYIHTYTHPSMSPSPPPSLCGVVFLSLFRWSGLNKKLHRLMAPLQIKSGILDGSLFKFICSTRVRARMNKTENERESPIHEIEYHLRALIPQVMEQVLVGFHFGWNWIPSILHRRGLSPFHSFSSSAVLVPRESRLCWLILVLIVFLTRNHGVDTIFDVFECRKNSSARPSLPSNDATFFSDGRRIKFHACGLGFFFYCTFPAKNLEPVLDELVRLVRYIFLPSCGPNCGIRACRYQELSGEG